MLIFTFSKIYECTRQRILHYMRHILFFMNKTIEMEDEEDKEDEENQVPGCETSIELKL